jgi:hypothetical protein
MTSLVASVASLIALRVRDRVRARRAERERRADHERLEAAARDLDDKVTHSQDGGPRYDVGI